MIEMVTYVEKWIDIPSYVYGVKPYYMVSTYGRIYSKYSKTIIAQCFNHNGYLTVNISTESGMKALKVHRLVLMCFNYIAGCEKLQVNHKNTIKTNNNLYNLEWMTPKENSIHAINMGVKNSYRGESNPKSTITNEQVRLIYDMIISGLSDGYISNHIGCSNDVVRQIALGNTWSWLFTDIELSNMKITRNGYSISTDQKHLICKYYEDNINKYIKRHGSVKNIAIDSLLNIGLEINDHNLRIAKRLFYKYQDANITCLYTY